MKYRPIGFSNKQCFAETEHCFDVLNVETSKESYFESATNAL